ncbi:phosphate ABC transporter substrate-binding protein PstS [Thiocystis violascens]|uniref:Phosphate-binding protein PstS n=1 Tax=Thiocystis violascens (strain ATCC 17096 / DSM 198 / 6111) TaxID=765911 RepID=I3Y7N4_THIV6|nr:phosphate ABC transporter substrate-binding protein PstS [Thiocystis violascens]AFL73002.1 phosphate ABC transporter substrate-binding protein, PhoT family [Thiocystis violascens DSM 198]
MMGKNALAGVLLALLAAGLPGLGVSDETADTLTIVGAGATFPAPLYQRWIIDYRQVRPDRIFTYDAVGSGEGVSRFLAGTVDFGASDAALSDKDLARVDPERGAIMIPMTAGMVVLAYNIPGVLEGLSLKRDVYLDIFAGRIRTWDDPRIRASNPGIALPNKAIVPVVRRDSSGTTFAFTNHLGAIDPWWSAEGPGIGKLIDWPGKAMTARGNEGVAQRVKITDGAIGYMEYEFAERLGMPVAILENRSGLPVMPSPGAGQAALASASEIPEDLRLFVPDPEGAEAYPIVSYTWILLNEHYADPAKGTALKDALTWGLDQGQVVARDLGYVPLPEPMIAKAREALARVR